MTPKGRLKKVVVAPVKPQVVPGPQGPRGNDGQGLQGPRGPVGEAPAHRWVGDSVQFKNPDGSWGPLRNFASAFSGGGSTQEHFKYTEITTATYTITHNQTVPGINIFGVNYEGAVTITVPESLPKDRTLIINDESGEADTNNITIQTQGN